MERPQVGLFYWLLACSSSSDTILTEEMQALVLRAWLSKHAFTEYNMEVIGHAHFICMYGQYLSQPYG